MARDDRPAEQPAVRTTIVGGRPPGPGKAVGPIPRGIEVLVKKAAVDPAFRERLLDGRAKAAEDIGLALDPAEALMLRAAPRQQLEAIIARTKVHPTVRSAFLGRAAAVMLVALGAGTLGCEKVPVVDGIAPDRPPAKQVEPPPAAEEATESTPPEAEPLPRVITGIQPAPPATEEAAKRTPPVAAPQSHGMAGIQPAVPAEVVEPLVRPERIEPTDGIRPMRPPEAPPKVEPAPDPKPPAPAPTGIRPDRPPSAKPAPGPGEEAASAAPRATAADPIHSTSTSDAVTRGVRPDRPIPKPPATGATATAEKPAPKPVTSLTLPAAWTEQESLRSFARGLKYLAGRLLPKHAYTFKEGKDGRITITWKTKEYRLTVPANKPGDTEIRDVTGPAPDGLILTVWMEKEPGQAVRPQTLDHAGHWQTDLKQVRLLPLKTNLTYHLDYGPKTAKHLVATFTTPQLWYRYHAMPEPGNAVTRGVRPDRPPTTKGIRPDRP